MFLRLMTLWTLKFDKKIIQKPKQTLLSKRKIVYYSRNLSNDKNTSIFIFNRVEVDIVATKMNLGFQTLKTDLRTIPPHCVHHTAIPILLADGSIVAFEEGPKTVNCNANKMNCMTNTLYQLWKHILT